MSDIYRETLVTLGLYNRIAVLDAHVQHRGTVESLVARIERSGFERIRVAT